MNKKTNFWKHDNPVNKLTFNEKKLLLELIENGRISDVELGKRLKISPQAANKIRRKLENIQLIREYLVETNHQVINQNLFVLTIMDICSNEKNHFTSIKDILEQKSISIRKIFISNKSYLVIFAFEDFQDMRRYIDFIHNKHSERIKIKEIHIFHQNDIIKKDLREISSKVIKDFNKEYTLIVPSLNISTQKAKVEKKESLSINEKRVLEKIILNGKMSCRQISRLLQEQTLTDKGIQKILARLEKRGAIKGYTIKLNYSKVGLNTYALIFIKKKPACWNLHEGLHRWLKETPHIAECYRLSENNCYAIIGYFKNLKEMEKYLGLIEQNHDEYIEVERVHLLTKPY